MLDFIQSTFIIKEKCILLGDAFIILGSKTFGLSVSCSFCAEKQSLNEVGAE